MAFLDNTLMLENAGTLVTYTLIFGGIALVLIFLLANYLAGKILAPLKKIMNGRSSLSPMQATN